MAFCSRIVAPFSEGKYDAVMLVQNESDLIRLTSQRLSVRREGK